MAKRYSKIVCAGLYTFGAFDVVKIMLLITVSGNARRQKNRDSYATNHDVHKLNATETDVIVVLLQVAASLSIVETNWR